MKKKPLHVKKQLLVLLILISSLSFAQTQTGNVTGKIVNSNDLPLNGIDVQIKELSRGTTTNEKGEYSFSDVKPGEYTLVVSGTGLRTETQQFTQKQDEETAPLQTRMMEDVVTLTEVVITGSAKPRTKLESSVAITTLSAKDINRIEPQSAADVFKVIPGFYVETSGGAVGNNLFARGIPSVGAYEYVQIQEDGLPVFEDGALQFANADNFFRFDETVEKVEAVKGGSGSIFASNAPGGIINIISKKGTNSLKLVGKISGGLPHGLFRVDANVSGPILKNKLFYSIGGFYRQDGGVRDPRFLANQGGQLKANLRYEFNKNRGFIQVNYKKLDDRTIFYLGIPLVNRDDPRGAPEVDANYGTLTSDNLRYLNVQQPQGGMFSRDLADGIHPKIDVIGANAKYNITPEFSVSYAVKQTWINQSYTAIFPGIEPVSLDAFMTNNYGQKDAISGERIPFSGTRTLTYLDNQQVASPALMANLGYWSIDKQMENFANMISLNFKKGIWNVVGGYYLSLYKAHQYWNWSNILADVTGRVRPLNLSFTDATGAYTATKDGVSSISTTSRDAQIEGTVSAFYADIEISASRHLTIDIGARFDMDDYTGYKTGNDTTNLDGDITTLYDNNVLSVVNNRTNWRYEVRRLSFSGAINYKINNNMAAYLRYSNGFRAPVEEALYNNAPSFANLRNTITNQIELGYKLSLNNLGLFVNVFYMKLDNIPFTDQRVDPQTGATRSENAFANAGNIGLELEANYRVGKFLANLRGTIQNPTYEDYGAYTGNIVRRIPQVYFTFTPSYDIMKNLNAFVQWGGYGRKFSDDANRAELPFYNEIGAGLNYTWRKFYVAFVVNNIFNAVGLTEGNPRLGLESTNSVYYGRPILGRYATLSITFRL